MSVTSKQMSERDYAQTLRASFNDVDNSITTGGFLVGKVGHKITRTVISPTVDDYSFYDGTVLLYTLRITYDSSTHDNVDQAERTA